MIGNKRISLIGGGGNNRQSNIEALRLLSMLMVLNLHSFWGYDHGSGVLQFADFFRESTSICAVNAFLLISGYFGIKWKFKSFFNLIFQLFFYAFGVYTIAVAFGFIEFSTKEFLYNATCIYKYWGFITAYVLLYMLSPMLNALAEKQTSRELLMTIIIFYVSEWLITRDCGSLNYGILYLIGRFIKKTDAVNRLEINATKSYWRMTILIFALVYGSYKLLHITTAEKMCGFVFGYSYSGPFVIMQAIFLFLVFARMNFTSKFINWCSASCLSIFLIHMHPAIRQIGYYNFTEKLYDLPVLQHVSILLLLFISVFAGCILIDKIRIFVSDAVYSFLCKVKQRFPQRLVELETYIPSVVKKLI